MAIRPAAVAGLFYPADGSECRAAVEALLAAAERQCRTPPRALIVPHAGYVYSGAMAARAYRQLQQHGTDVRRVVVACPNHRVPLRGIAVPTADAFATPLGDVPVDTVAVAELAAGGEVTWNDEAHRREHGIEVQLPFLQVVLSGFQLVPLVVGECAPERVARVLGSLWREDTLLVVSSDLSHYLDYEAARSRDADTCREVLAGHYLDGDNRACGAIAVNGLLALLNTGSSRLMLLGANNSGDTAGDRRRVVGYAAFAA